MRQATGSLQKASAAAGWTLSTLRCVQDGALQDSGSGCNTLKRHDAQAIAALWWLMHLGVRALQIGSSFVLSFAVTNSNNLVAQVQRTITVASPCSDAQFLCDKKCANVTCSELNQLQAATQPQATGPAIGSSLLQTSNDNASRVEVPVSGGRRGLLQASSSSGQVFLAYGFAAVRSMSLLGGRPPS